MSTQFIDQKARDMAQAAQNQISSHERECAIFRAASTITLKEIKSILAWGITALIGAMGTLIWYLATHPHG